MKRFMALISAICVCTCSCFAAAPVSFLGRDYSDPNNFYSFDVVPRSSLMLLASEPDNSLDDALYEIPFGQPSSFEWTDTYDAKLFLWADIYLGVVGMDVPTVVAENNAATLENVVYSSSSRWYGVRSASLTFDTRDFENSFQGYSAWSHEGFSVGYDVPVPSGSYGLSFTPYIGVYGQSSMGGVSEYYSVYCYLLINGNQYLSFTNNYRDDGYYQQEHTFTFSQPIESVSFVYVYPPHSGLQNGLPSSDIRNGSVSAYWRMWERTDSTCTIGFLGEFGALGQNVDQAQNDINDHNAFESEWTGSMSDNFDALNLSSFTIPAGLVSAFTMIESIFNDLWMSLGEYRIVYVLPLTLGVVLVVIGKMSRTERKNSSVRGDPGASLVVRDR